MKIIDTRDSTIMSGTLIATLPAKAPVSEEDMLTFYRLRPDDKNYSIMQKAVIYDRLVLRRGDEDSDSFFIVPHYPFYDVRP